jgi:hypothetical protein
MKKNFIPVTVIMAALIIGTAATLNAQDDLIAKESFRIKRMDIVALLGPENPDMFFAGNNFASLNAKISKRILRKFPGATNATWYQEGGLTYFDFYENGTMSHVATTKNGQELYAVRYYHPNQLPSHVARDIKEVYRGYRISSVTELSANDGIGYFMNLEGIDDWLQVRYQNGELETLYRYTY